VPREGQGTSVQARPWPRSAMRTALAAAPIAVVSGKSPTTPTEPAAPAGNGAFVASKRSGVFHTATCANGKRIADKNRTAFDSVAAADKAGKKPAKCCNPGK